MEFTDDSPWTASAEDELITGRNDKRRIAEFIDADDDNSTKEADCEYSAAEPRCKSRLYTD